MTEALKKAHEAIDRLFALHPPCDTDPGVGCPHVLEAHAALDLAVEEARLQEALVSARESALREAAHAIDPNGCDPAQSWALLQIRALLQEKSGHPVEGCTHSSIQDHEPDCEPLRIGERFRNGVPPKEKPGPPEKEQSDDRCRVCRHLLTWHSDTGCSAPYGDAFCPCREHRT